MKMNKREPLFYEYNGWRIGEYFSLTEKIKIRCTKAPEIIIQEVDAEEALRQGHYPMFGVWAKVLHKQIFHNKRITIETYNELKECDVNKIIDFIEQSRDFGELEAELGFHAEIIYEESYDEKPK